MGRWNPVWRGVAIVASALLLLLTVAPLLTGDDFCWKCLFECPKDDSIGKACLRSVIPPWPICKFRSIPDFIEHAKDSATRCCGDDLSECRYPKKNTTKFLEDIGPWCQGVASCPNGDDEDDEPGDENIAALDDIHETSSSKAEME